MTNQSSRRRRGAKRAYDAGEVRRRIIKARDTDPIRSMIIYSRNKAGKTRLAASAIRIGKTLLIDCEKGATTIREVYPEVDVYHLTEFEQIDEVYWYLTTQKHGYQFIIIDPISRLQQHAMNFVLREKVSIDLSADPFQPSQPDWGKTAEMLRKVVLQYKEIPGIFLIITAYERRRKIDDEDDGDYDFVIGPDVQPALKGFLLGQMDVIARLYVRQLESGGATKIERRLLTAPHPIYDAGDRSDKLPRIIRQPTMKKIMDILNSKGESQ